MHRYKAGALQISMSELKSEQETRQEGIDRSIEEREQQASRVTESRKGPYPLRVSVIPVSYSTEEECQKFEAMQKLKEQQKLETIERLAEEMNQKELDSAITPSHYKGDLVMRVIEDWYLDFCLGNTVKYILRHRNKNQLQDLKKGL